MFTGDQVFRCNSQLDDIEHWIQSSHYRWKSQMIDYWSYLFFHYIRSKAPIRQFSRRSHNPNVYEVKIYFVTGLKDHGRSLLLVIVQLYVLLKLVDG